MVLKAREHILAHLSDAFEHGRERHAGRCPQMSVPWYFAMKSHNETYYRRGRVGGGRERESKSERWARSDFDPESLET